VHRPVKYLEKGLSVASGLAWLAFRALNDVRPAPSFTPAWSDLPLLKSHEKSRPPLGWPRQTDSLCPVCVQEIRQAILEDRQGLETLMETRAGQIPATIVERDGHILMEKDCPVHGHFEDVLAIDADFFGRMERMFPGRDVRAHRDESVHRHGVSSIRFGRGAVLTVDLTNRCNMMCDPCFMDANQVGFVHELEWPDIKQILDNALAVRPRRQMSVQFSGGEPTLSPHFLDAVRYARTLGYKVIQAATNGIEFARSRDFARAAAEAGLRYAYLQFDGIGNAANAHRRVGNLFDVKMQAIEHLFEAGVSIVPVVTIVNGINNEQVGRVIDFALDNPRRIAFVAFQPVSFSGRDETITDERRRAQRYTLSHLAHDVKQQARLGEPLRDWFPISFLSTFTEWADLVHGPQAAWGQLTCGCHPNCGVGMAVMVDKETREAVPVTAFLHAEQLARDVATINDAGRGRILSIVGLTLAIMRNYDPFAAPAHFSVLDLLRKFAKKFDPRNRGRSAVPGRTEEERRRHEVAARRQNRWNFLFIAGMWFQDLFNYDFRRTEMCIIPYGTQQGEVSFCAYNTGVGWRQIVEKMHLTATLTRWYETHGRHAIFAGNRDVPLPSSHHSMTLRTDALDAPIVRAPDKAGTPRNAREEQIHARMAALYRKHVLRAPTTIQIQGLGRHRHSRDPGA